MLLPDWRLRQEVTGRKLVRNAPADGRDPLDGLQPASLDVTLSGTFWLPEDDVDEPIDPEQPEDIGRVVHIEPGHVFELQPGGFALASTREWFDVPTDLALQLEGRSSLARRGLLVHATAGFIDPGFRGAVTLELSNLRRRSIVLRPGLAVAQVLAHRLEAAVEQPYGSPACGSKYQGQVGPTRARQL